MTAGAWQTPAPAAAGYPVRRFLGTRLEASSTGRRPLRAAASLGCRLALLERVAVDGHHDLAGPPIIPDQHRTGAYHTVEFGSAGPSRRAPAQGAVTRLEGARALSGRLGRAGSHDPARPRREWQTHRPPPAGAGSVVNRCGGGWSAGGRRAVRPRESQSVSTCTPAIAGRRLRHSAIGVALLPRGPVDHGAPFAGTAGLLSGRVEARVVQPPVGIRPLKSLVLLREVPRSPAIVIACADIGPGG